MNTHKTILLSLLATFFLISANAQNKPKTSKATEKPKNMGTTQKKMTIEIWSDIMCPFSYLGKVKFEKALDQFADKGHIEVIWKSFQLMPTLQTDTTIRIHEYLAKSKGWSLEQAKRANNQVG